MNAVIQLNHRLHTDAKERLEAFIHLARFELSNLITTEDWVRAVWIVTEAFVRKGKPRVSSRLFFFQDGSLVGRGSTATGSPLSEPFADFAKAYIRYTSSAAPATFTTVEMRLGGVRAIERAFREMGIFPDIQSLTPDVLNNAVRIATADVVAKVRYRRAISIAQVHEFCTQQELLPSSFGWKHGVARPLEAMQRTGHEFDDLRAEKLPSRAALEGLAHIYRNPQNLRDEFLSAASFICICSPWRASEVLQLKDDCEVNTDRQENGVSVPAYGLRAFPAKDNAPQVKWVLDIAADQVRQAVERLRRLSADARVIAEWYVRHPDQIYLPPDFEYLRDSEWISLTEISNLLGWKSPKRCERSLKIKRQICADQKSEYRFVDFEKSVLSQIMYDFPFQNGLKTHKYSEALMIFPRDALELDEMRTGSRVMFDVFDINQFNSWLSGRTDTKSVFERFGLEEQDGTPICITTHSFRHWNNTVAQRRGLSQEDIALWSGREIGQNKFYDHQTPAQMRQDLKEIAIAAGGIGPLFDAADSLTVHSLITREEFLKTQLAATHVTEYGCCSHFVGMQPCINFGDCSSCGENYFVKGDAAHRASISSMLQIAELQLSEARTCLSEDEYGADLWVFEHERRAQQLRAMIAIHDDVSVNDGILVSLPHVRQDSEIEQAVRRRGGRANNRMDR